MNLLAILKRKKHQETAPVELASKEAPLQLKATPPKGTKFNRTTIYIIGGVFALITLVSVISSLTPAKKLTPEEEAAKRFDDTGSKDKVQYNNTTPDQITDMPANYSSMATFRDTQQRRAEASGMFQSAVTGTAGPGPGLGLPVPAGIGSIKQASQGAADAYGDNYDQSQPRRASLAEAAAAAESKETAEALKSPIRFPGQSTAAPSVAPVRSGESSKLDLASLKPQSLSPNMPDLSAIMGGGDQNMQDKKEKFIEKFRDPRNYVAGNLMPPVSRFELKAGSIIPISLLTGINSDLPGDITAQVTQNVYDTVSGKFLLVPQGARLVGLYDSKVAYAQERVLVVWTRLIMPNGNSINLENMGGVDLSGYAGFSDKVNNHWMKIISGVVLSSMLAVATKVATGNAVEGQATIPQQAGGAIAEQIGQVGQKITQKNLNIQPTLEISQGYKCNVFVNKDLVLKPYVN